MNKNSIEIKKRYDRYSYIYDLLEFFPENLFFKKIRKQVIPKLSGKVLEVGAGTGKNLPYYTDVAQVTAIDFSDKMIAKAERKASKLKRKNIKIKKADVENLPFLDNSFDFVLATFVFCSVPDPVKGFEEIKRILKDDGQAIFIEHVKSENILYQKFQNLLNPLTVGIFGFNINRDTKNNISKSGLTIRDDVKLAHNDVFRKFFCEK